jgi:hypothetical protein
MAAIATLAACGASGGAGVPTLRGTPNGASSTHQGAALHAAAQCIRDHGIPDYADPVIGPGDVVYADQRDLENAGDAAVASAVAACQTLISRANFDPTTRPVPPPQMVRDGVRVAACLRAHGLPNWPDPNPHTGFDPGHGFQVDASAFAGAVSAGQNPKASAVYQAAYHACQTLIQTEIRDSQLSNLAHGQ